MRRGARCYGAMRGYRMLLASDSGATTMADRSVTGEQDDGPDDRHDESSAVTFAVPTQGPAEETRQHRARDPERDRDDRAAGIFARHDGLGERADDESDEKHPENVHIDVP